MQTLNILIVLWKITGTWSSCTTELWLVWLCV